MNTHQFIFPPPPPPPPPAVNVGPVNHVGPPAGHSYGRNGRENKVDRATRGRGRNSSKRGSRGGNHGSLNASGHNGYAQGNDRHFSPLNNYRPPTSVPGSSYPLPEYPPVQQTQYLPNVSNAYGHPVITHPTHPVAPFPSNPEYRNDGQRLTQFLGGQPPSTSYAYNPLPQIPSYYPQEPQNYGPRPPGPENPGQPAFMGPPLRMGFKNVNPGQNQQVQFHTQMHQPPPLLPPSFHVKPSGRSRSTRHDSPNPFPDHRNRGQRRNNDGSGGSRRFHPKLQVAPAVPSFGNPLPVKPPAPQENGRKPKKKKRRHNQLGLTPKTIEHESSEEEENDLDEETKLAIAAGYPESERQQLRIIYKGQVSTLQSASEITSWIEERKKRFPTKAKMEERRERQRHTLETQQAVRQLIKESKAKNKAEYKEMQKAEFRAMKKSKTDRKPSEPCGENKVESKEVKKELNLSTDNAAAKSKLKVEKLRKRLEKEEKRVAKAEAKVSRLKVQVSDVQPGDSAPAVSPPDKKRKRSESVASEVKAEVEDNQMIKIEQVNLPMTEVVAPVGQERAVDIKKEDEETTRYVESTPVEGKRLAASVATHGPLTPTSQPSIAEELELNSSRNSVQPTGQLLASPSKFAVIGNQPYDPKELHGLNIDQSSVSAPVSESTLSSSLSSSVDSEDDSTSSEGSSSSSGSSSAPEPLSLKRAEPEKGPPPTQHKTRRICRNFLQNGRCGKGDRCRFRHELPERGSRPSRSEMERRKKAVRESKRSQRLGLYQRLVEQEKQNERAEAIEKEKETNDLPTLGASVQLEESSSLAETGDGRDVKG